MLMSFILTFYGVFILFSLTGTYIFIVFYNKRTKILIDQFALQTNTMRYDVFNNIKLRYWETRYYPNIGDTRTYIYLNNTCDIYLFDNYFAIVRRQNFVFKVSFPPILISSQNSDAQNIFNYLDIYYPKRISFIKVKIGELDFNVVDSNNKYITVEITVKGLTQEQIERFEVLRQWSLTK